MAADPSSLDRYFGNPDFEAFAATIAAEPEDEAPRLVLSDWFREQGDDAAADLAILPTFATQLAFARFRKAVGGSGPMAASHVERFRGAGESIRVRMIPYIERFQQMTTVDAARETPEPAKRLVERSGRRQAMPRQKKKRGK